MISRLKHSVACILFAVMVNCACDSRKEISINETDAEMFLYDSPITALSDAGDSLLLGTARGDIVSFSLVNGTFRHIPHYAEGRFIYNILKDADSYLYSVQDGGINHILNDGTIQKYPLNSYKECNYSAYDFICSDGNIYAATSNGVYHWDAPEMYAKRLDESIQDDLNDAIRSRFYSIQKEEEDCEKYICAGEAGLYSFDISGVVECLHSSSLYSCSDSIILSREREIYVDRKHLTDVEIPALDVAYDGRYVYAISMHAVEVIDISTGEHIVTINLPERKSSYKNASCRSFSLIKDGYIYIAPGGCTLYRVPVYEYTTDSEEVVQVCASSEGSAYFLTDRNDLYHLDSDNKDIKYLRSFDDTKELKLICAGNGYIVVTIDGIYYELSGKRLTDEKHLSDLNRLNKSKVLWHLYDGNHLYQGQVDRIRKYSRASGWALSHEYEQLDYPKLAALYGENLIVNTLHDGTYHLKDSSFAKIKDISETSIKDIDGGDDMICALTDTSVELMNTLTGDKVNIDLDNASYQHLTDVNVMNYREVVAFSTYNRWCKGFILYNKADDSSWKASRYLVTHLINDAASVGDEIVVGGTMGISVLQSGGRICTIDVPAPTFFEKHVLAWKYPWGIVIYVIVLLVLLGILVWGIILIRRYYLKYKMKRMVFHFMNWVESEYKGKYIRSLGKQLIKVSPDCKSLSTNIAMFRSMKAELDNWEAFIDDVVILYDKVKSLKAQDIELGHQDEITALKERLEYFCKSDHPFGSSIIKEWGKTTVQPIRTLMLLPLKFKIKFMQIFDSRTGTEKMDFKAFMEADKTKIQQRKLEIRDLIALSAFEVIISEKAATDA